MLFSGLFFLWSWIVRTIRRPAWWRSVPRLLRKDGQLIWGQRRPGFRVCRVDSRQGGAGLEPDSHVPLILTLIILARTLDPAFFCLVSSCPSTRRSWSRTRLPRTVNFDSELRLGQTPMSVSQWQTSVWLGSSRRSSNIFSGWTWREAAYARSVVSDSVSPRWGWRPSDSTFRPVDAEATAMTVADGS